MFDKGINQKAKLKVEFVFHKNINKYIKKSLKYNLFLIVFKGKMQEIFVYE
jgi:hypothetical protein